jgi:hypothetical protein
MHRYACEKFLVLFYKQMISWFLVIFGVNITHDVKQNKNSKSLVVHYSWFSRDVIAAMLVSHEQTISH